MTFDIVRNGQIYIPEDMWRDMNHTLSRDQIKQYISDTIVRENIPLPMRQISEADAIAEFQLLSQFDAKTLIESTAWCTRFEYDTLFHQSNTLVRTSNIGNIASDYFQQVERWRCDSINSPSPARTWATEKFRLTLLNGLWSLKMKQVTTQELRSLIGLRKYIASQFRPSAAKAIYQIFSGTRVLDFSSGWGDRLCGFLATDETISYTGIDPNTNLVAGYNKQISLYNTNKHVEMIQGRAEDDSILGDRTFDLIFTSPPYFNIERYTHDDQQSFKRYKKIDMWLSQFMFKTIDNVWSRLETGGHLIINISDVYSNHTINKICDPMNKYIATQCGAEYVGCWGYEMRKRPNSGALRNKTGLFAEPMWIWKKGAC
jgi:hypothetical protein